MRQRNLLRTNLDRAMCFWPVPPARPAPFRLSRAPVQTAAALVSALGATAPEVSSVPRSTPPYTDAAVLFGLGRHARETAPPHPHAPARARATFARSSPPPDTRPDAPVAPAVAPRRATAPTSMPPDQARVLIAAPAAPARPCARGVPQPSRDAQGGGAAVADHGRPALEARLGRAPVVQA